MGGREHPCRMGCLNSVLKQPESRFTTFTTRGNRSGTLMSIPVVPSNGHCASGTESKSGVPRPRQSKDLRRVFERPVGDRWRAFVASAAIVIGLVSLSACSSGGGGGGGNGGNDNDRPVPTVIIDAPMRTVSKGQSAQFSATVVDAGPGVSWTVEGGAIYGTIAADGLYTAPLMVPDGPVIVRATSTDDPRGTSTTTIQVVVGNQLERKQANVAVPVGVTAAPASTFSGGQRSVAVSGPLAYLVWSEKHNGIDRAYLSVSRDHGLTVDQVPVAISPEAAAGPHSYPVVAVDGLGRAVVAWIGSGDGMTWNVYARAVSIDAAGSPILGSIHSIAVMGAVGDPLVALDVDRAGNAYVAWSAEPGPSETYTRVLVARVAAATSGAFTPSGTVHASVTVMGHQNRPVVAVSDGGALLVAWIDPRDDPDGTNDVWWRLGSVSGGAIQFGDPERRVNFEVAGSQAHASVALNEDGVARIVWSGQRSSQRRHVYFVQSEPFNLGDPNQSREVLVVDSDGLSADQNIPSLAVDPNGEVTIAFADNRVCVQRTNPPTNCTINGNGTGQGDGTGQTDIYVVRKLAGETAFSQNVIMNDDSALPGVQQHGRPSVEVDDVGRAVVFWTDDRNGISQPFLGRME